MSVKFDKTNLSNAGDWLRADGAAMAPSVPFSVSLWVYFENHVTGDPETIWFYGEQGHDHNYVVLEAVPVSGQTRLRVRLVEPVEQAVIQTGTSAVLATDTWHLVTVVVTFEGGTDTRLTLYVDDQSTVTQAADIGTTSEDVFDRFALGRWAGNTLDENPCSFHAEQVAIWNSALDEEDDHDEMWTNRTPPHELASAPGLGHWVLAGHRRHGLRTHNSQNQPVEGDLNNEAGGSQPDMELSSNNNPGPLWSVKTPGLLYDDGVPTPSSVPPRDPKRRVRRSDPHFYFFAKPELSLPYKPPEEAGIHPIWNNRNMSVMARVPYHFAAADEAKYEPPEYGNHDYFPTSYLTQIAKRVADWFEYQGFKKRPTGCVFIQGLGSQNAGTGTLGRNKQETNPVGTGLGIPLEMHPKDDERDTPDPTYPWATWFRANGEALVKEYSEEFWPLLKAELDRRNLAYPHRLHWDDENSPLPGRVIGDPDHQVDPIVGTFPQQLEDGRANKILGVPAPTDPGEAIVDGKALQDIWGSGNAWNTYFPEEPAYDSSNDNWRVWYLGWMRMIRQDALDTAIMTPAANEFPKMKWSNYNDIVADNPEYPHYFHHPKDAVVTPLSSIPADFSAPVLYSNTNWNRLRIAGFGKSPQIVQWEIWNRGIEACVNTSSGTPFVPWVCNVGYTAVPNPVGTNYPYTTLSVDLRWLLRRCWQRGANEFIVWVEEDAADGDLDKTYKECEDLVKWAQCQTKGNGKNCR